MRGRTILLLLCLATITAMLSGCFQSVGPIARFSATPAFDYPPLETVLDASASTSPDGAIVSYDWDFGDGETGTGAVVTHTYEDKGIYEITLVVTDSNGKTGARVEAVEALNRIPTASFSASSYWVGAEQPISFDASDSSDADGQIVQYLWDFGDGTSAEGMEVEHVFPHSPTGGGWKPIVTLTVVDEDGGTGSMSQPVNVVGCSSCG